MKTVRVFQITGVGVLFCLGIQTSWGIPLPSNVYGSGIAADALSNLRVGAAALYSPAFRFRADHTGPLNAVQPYIIYTSEKPGYSAGTGGTVHVELQTDDGTSAHHPSGTVLDSTDLTYNLTDTTAANPNFPVFTFSKQPLLQAGTLYHIVFTNTDPDPVDNYVSVDDLWQASPPVSIQPTINNLDWSAELTYTGGTWGDVPGQTPILQLDYADSTLEGMGYMEVWTSTKSISGQNAVRENFTVSGANQSVSSVSIRLAKGSGTDALTVRLENGSGTLIEQGTIANSAINSQFNWVTYTFQTPHTLASNQAYHLVLTAPGTSTYSIYPIRKGVEHGYSATTYFSDGDAEYTTDSATWSGWPLYGESTEPPSTEADLQFYFSSNTTATPSCDVNGDGVVNVADVQLEVDMTLGLKPCTNPSMTCTVTSIQRVINAVLSGSCPVAP